MNHSAMAQVRTFGLVGHRSAGKTTLAEAMLAAAGAVRQAGRISEGTTLLDYAPEEHRLQRSLWSAFAWLNWEDTEVHLIDTPGLDVTPYARRLALHGTDLLLICIEAGPRLQDDVAQLLQDAQHDPRRTLVVVTRMRANVATDTLLEQIGAASGATALPLNLPFLDDDGGLAGELDLMTARARRVGDDGRVAVEPLNHADAHRVARAREALQEGAAMCHEDLLEHYLEYLELGDSQVWDGLRRGMDTGDVLPVLFTEASRRIGVEGLLHAAIRLAPEPSRRQLPTHDADRSPSFVAQWVSTGLDPQGQLYRVLRVWKGEAPVRGAWVHPESGRTFKLQKLYRLRGKRRAQAKQRGAGTLLATWEDLPGEPGAVYTDGPAVSWSTPRPPDPMAWREVRATRPLDEPMRLIAALDPSIRVTSNAEGLQVSGRSSVDLDAALQLLRTRFALVFDAVVPPVPRRRTLYHPVAHVEGTYQVGEGWERDAYAHVVLSVTPSVGEGISFSSVVDEEDLPTTYVEAVERACLALPTSPVACDGLAITLVDGAYDMLASAPEHYEHAVYDAVERALKQGGERPLVAWVDVKLTVPLLHLGHVLAALPGWGGRVQSVEAGTTRARILTALPEADLSRLEARLAQVTSGRGRFGVGDRRFLAS